MRLRCDAAEQLDVLNAAYQAQFGTDLVVNDSYRSYAGQVACKRTKGYLCATPGTSNHGSGIAVDLGGGIETFGTKQHRWMAAHAPDLSWVPPVVGRARAAASPRRGTGSTSAEPRLVQSRADRTATARRGPTIGRMSTSAEPGRTWPLVGRAAELDDLDDLLSTAADGVGVTVLLEGEAGVGKTSLVDALRGSARLLDVELRTAQATSMRGWPFALLSDALLRARRPAAATARPQPRRGRARGPARRDVRRPGPLRRPATTGPRSCSPPSCAATATSGPWALVLEDVHEADAPSLAVLLQLAREGAVPRALVVLTMRPVPVPPRARRASSPRGPAPVPGTSSCGR